MNDTDPAGLMRAAQAGDRQAYAQLLKAIVPTIRRMVVSRCGPGVDADDIVQDVLLSVHSVRRTYDPRRPFNPWLAAIVRARLIDAYRKRGRIARHERSVAELPETPDGVGANPQREGASDNEWLERAIADLPPGQQRAVRLLKLRELSLKEASAASGLSTTALKVAVHRALKTLRARFADRK